MGPVVAMGVPVTPLAKSPRDQGLPPYLHTRNGAMVTASCRHEGHDVLATKVTKEHNEEFVSS